MSLDGVRRFDTSLVNNKKDSTIVNSIKLKDIDNKIGEIKNPEVKSSTKDVNGINKDLSGTNPLKKEGISFNFVEPKSVSHFGDKNFLGEINLNIGKFEEIAKKLIENARKQIIKND